MASKGGKKEKRTRENRSGNGANPIHPAKKFNSISHNYTLSITPGQEI